VQQNISGLVQAFRFNQSSNEKRDGECGRGAVVTAPRAALLEVPVNSGYAARFEQRQWIGEMPAGEDGLERPIRAWQRNRSVGLIMDRFQIPTEAARRFVSERIRICSPRRADRRWCSTP
jgi:hypothetical protein